MMDRSWPFVRVSTIALSACDTSKEEELWEVQSSRSPANAVNNFFWEKWQLDAARRGVGAGVCSSCVAPGVIEEKTGGLVWGSWEELKVDG